ncbi:uncharacterized protein LOC121400955 [Xenopus laevis]|uniref:Uncharacterized protein LOC121400955 n=1 Tax=Xenopus laevis TaxID=8355 RepID=A0A8J1MIB0_XENLA|nr:uncharacterized protein LOC121400955 [Xenopus laevis]XP_041441239.1 uncharacterized protein LOC121400955 [Xenopus laevis]
MHSAQGVYESPQSSHCLPQTPRDHTLPIFGRPPNKVAFLRAESSRHSNLCHCSQTTRLAHQPQKEPAPTVTENPIPGDVVRLLPADYLIDLREDPNDHAHSSSCPPAIHGVRRTLPSFVGLHGSSTGGPALRQVPHESVSKSFSEALEQGSLQPVPTNSNDRVNKAVITMVDIDAQPCLGENLDHTPMDSGHNRRQSHGLGGHLATSQLPRHLVAGGIQVTNQRSRNQSDKECPSSLVTGTDGKTAQDSVRQCHSSGLPKQTGRYSQPPSNEGSGSDLRLGGIPCSSRLRSFHTGRTKLGGGLPQPATDRPRRVGTASRGVSTTRFQMWGTRQRHVGLKTQLQSSYLLRQVSRPGGSVCGRLSHTMDFREGLCFSTSSSTATSHTQDPTGGDANHTYRPRLAKEGMVLRDYDLTSSSSVAVASQTGFTNARPSKTRQFTRSPFDGVALESEIWLAKGFSEQATDILLKARKQSTSKVYHKTWKTFIDWCEAMGFPWRQASIQTIVEFLTQGFQLGLSLATLKGQVSALSLLLQHQWAREPDLIQFLQGVGKVRPPFRDPTPPWDLTTVLHALQGPPFEPLASCSLKFLTWKMSFLLAITSAKRVSDIAALSQKEPWLILHQDRVVFRTVPSFTPKVVSSFHINEEINLPSLCPRPSNVKEKELHKLDVVRAIRYYLDRSKSYRKTDTFLVTYGYNQGSPANYC